ncbi:TIGR03085 family metal-binding protein [Solwaraspora sp. WMMA2080]|uniref:TIGR03085 family metal-binding protein n=1 Tax=unclassified Solwaraspora TaxID=2627926 RepID=UPI00248D201C|nr:MULTISPECIES: TIGR03085 family metal-binding protein [unclassified Solwaraspora]WBB94942.1 TIGR03085 family metal-binding protein [Solwaraspora sp. WMMA2059]WBC21175.1 TIGR03085 family metal-binding protein [Solwaraspora sp. WMMA2080]
MARFAQMERHALADLFLAVGPDAPTVNVGWTTRDLAAHLIVREQRPDAAAGIWLPLLRGYSERVRLELAARSFPDLVRMVRQPPAWSPVSNRITDEVVNLMEFFIHHEDVRRAQPDWQTRDLPPGEQAALWKRVSALTKLRLRRFPGTVTVVADGYGDVATGTGTGTGGDQVSISAPPGELVLFLTGRQRVARVQMDCAAPVEERLRNARFGF